MSSFVLSFVASKVLGHRLCAVAQMKALLSLYTTELSIFHEACNSKARRVMAVLTSLCVFPPASSFLSPSPLTMAAARIGDHFTLETHPMVRR